MGRTPRQKLAKLESAGRGRLEGSAQRPYVAKLVSSDELCRVITARGGLRDLDDHGIAWIAGRQLGLITTWQLQALGTSPGAISRRVGRGALHRVHRGVFLVGHAVCVPGARELAAVLACGDGAFVSHRSSAFLWGLADVAGEEVQVSVIGKSCAPRPGVRVHRVRRLDARDRALRNGIPTTSPARALVDLAASADLDEVERALAEAQAQGILSEGQLSDTLDRARNRAGVSVVRAILRHQAGPRLTRSEAERRLLALIRAANLPVPKTNARVAGFEVDFFWPEARLIVEVDGFAFHGRRKAFERDRRRDMALRDRAFEVIRVTWRQLVDQPFLVVAHIARALERAGHLRSIYSSSANSP
jgi:very-short-patch-repair endonuclease